MDLNQTQHQALCRLLDFGQRKGWVHPHDRIWLYNTLLDAIAATGPAPLDFGEAEESDFNLDETLEILSFASVERGRDVDTQSGKDRAAMRLMGLLMPTPAQVEDAFNARLANGSKAATDFFYTLCTNAGYVRKSAIAKNVKWTTQTDFGPLEITINLSKPEKDPREIAAALSAPKDAVPYPACQLCIQNEGYSGRGADSGLGAHPARQNLRIIPITLAGEPWGFQYSPYAYFEEHCIAMSTSHRTMHIDGQAIDSLFDFVDLFPHYFIGSNADLPIVGGSILSHDHFQGGAHVFPMMKAEIRESLNLPKFPEVTLHTLRWPMSVIRLNSSNKEAIKAAATHIITSWKAYSDPDATIYAHTDEGGQKMPHNTITPIIRRTDDPTGTDGAHYEAYLALRNNLTSDEHPLGIYHPHAEWHHIKRENIGIIEVMGLAILPPRLVHTISSLSNIFVEAKAQQLTDISELLAKDPALVDHSSWAKEIYTKRLAEINKDQVEDILKEEIGIVFSHVLEDAGVFKTDEAGQAAFKRFIESL